MTYTFSFLRNMVVHKGFLVPITATTGNAASLYQSDRTLQSLLGIGTDYKYSSNDGISSRTSRSGPRSQRAKLLRKLALIIIDEVPMMERKLFDLVDVLLKICGVVEAESIVIRLVE